MYVINKYTYTTIASNQVSLSTICIMYVSLKNQWNFNYTN